MSAEHELLDSLKLIPFLEHQVASQGETLENQADWLEAQIDELVRRSNGSFDSEKKMEALSKLSLLSELCAVISFDRMIEARERFKSLFPEHFDEYLNRLDSLSWQMSWPGCLECSHFSGKCSLGITPAEKSGGSYGFEKSCKFKEMKAQAA